MIKVSSARFHLGVQLGADVKTGLSEKVNQAEMYLDPKEGLYITKMKNKELPEPILVPMGMLNMAYLDAASAKEYLAAKAKAKKNDKG